MDYQLSPHLLGNTDHLIMTSMINGYEFTNEANFDHFINHIQGETPNMAVPDFGILGGCSQFAGELSPADMFDAHVTMAPPVADCVLDSLPSFEYDYNNGDYSSGTCKKKHEVERSRTLVSERRRRHCMKEKLYALRSLVPNITKMDKASIVGDAALYVEQLQMQAKILKSEIAGLEKSLLSASAKYQGSSQEDIIIVGFSKSNLHLACRKMILQMDVFQVEEKGFYVRLVSNKEEGVAASLYKVLEALTGFIVQSSNLTTVSETFVLTFILNLGESEQKLNLPNLKFRITGALMKQGFEFKDQMFG